MEFNVIKNLIPQPLYTMVTGG